MNKNTILALFLALVLCSCGASRQLEGGAKGGIPKAGGTEAATKRADLQFLQHIYDNQPYQKAISQKIDFTLNKGDKDVSVSGKLQMKKGTVIRIQLTPFGLMEAGRLEFTPDYVLVLDRINKRFARAEYKDVDFLAANGLDYYAMEALFWNLLYIPGEKAVTNSQLRLFSVEKEDEATGQRKVTLERGNLGFCFLTDVKTAQIRSTEATYTSATHGTTSVRCRYNGFEKMGQRLFPKDMLLTFDTPMVKNAKEMSMRIHANKLTNDGDFEDKTTVGDKYKEVKVDELFKHLF